MSCLQEHQRSEPWGSRSPSPRRPQGAGARRGGEGVSLSPSARSKAWQAKQRKQGRCWHCGGKTIPGTTRCAERIEYERARYLGRRDQPKP